MSRRLALVAVLALLPAVALAAEGDSELGPTIWHAINLLLIVGVLVYFGRTPVQTYMIERRQHIEEGIESARRELAEAEQRLAFCNERMASLDREVEEIRSTVRAQAEAERERLLEEARASAERIRRDARTAVEQEARRVREDLRSEAADLAVRLAGEILERQVGDAERARLVDEFVRHVEAQPARPAARS
jgi:F-type H+-transporting ATPase subunit b